MINICNYIFPLPHPFNIAAPFPVSLFLKILRHVLFLLPYYFRRASGILLTLQTLFVLSSLNSILCKIWSKRPYFVSVKYRRHQISPSFCDFSLVLSFVSNVFIFQLLAVFYVCKFYSHFYLSFHIVVQIILRLLLPSSNYLLGGSVHRRFFWPIHGS